MSDVVPSTPEFKVSPAAAAARLWPGWVVLVGAVVAFVISVTPSINNFVRFGYMMLGPLVGAVLGLVWLLFFSRLSRRERLTVAGLAVLLSVVAWQLSVPELGVAVWVHGGSGSVATHRGSGCAADTSHPRKQVALQETAKPAC